MRAISSGRSPSAPSTAAASPAACKNSGAMARRVALLGSCRARPADAPVGAADPAGRVTVSLYLKDPAEPPRVPGSAEDFAALAQPTTRAALAARRQQQFAEAAR